MPASPNKLSASSSASSASSPAAALLTQYAGYHRDSRNIGTHFIGIPLIVFALGILLAGLGGPVAALVWVLSTVWYLRQGHRGLALATSAANGLLIALALPVAAAPPDVWLSWGLSVFVLGWIWQFVGHVWEGRKPAFMDDVRGLLVGPMFVVAEAWFALGGGAALKAEIESQVGPVRRAAQDLGHGA